LEDGAAADSDAALTYETDEREKKEPSADAFLEV
jgi:hypothetical protein